MSTTRHIQSSIPALEEGMLFLELYIRERLEVYFGKKHYFDFPRLPHLEGNSTFASFINENLLSTEEFVILMIAFVPHLDAGFFNNIIARYLSQGGEFSEFGGVKGTNHRGILPTGETVLFILGGNDLEMRVEAQKLLSKEQFLVKHQVIAIDHVKDGEPAMSGKLVIDNDFLSNILFQSNYIEKFSSDFPAEPLFTEMEWDDLVLNPNTIRQIRELETWIKYNDVLLHDWGMSKKLKPGYRALFYGPPGTGKTLTATLLGKFTQRLVFRIDSSVIVSKYIGETEKNLSKLFDKAQNKNWILFFDEADAIFSKRTSVRDAHDKYANQEASYLLQRIENYPGVVILASNFKSNLDEAFIRRFQSMIYFSIPGFAERLLLWQKAFPAQVVLEGNVDLEKIAHKYELSGSNVMNIVHYCCLQALAQQTHVITSDDLIKGIEREYAKEGKLV